MKQYFPLETRLLDLDVVSDVVSVKCFGVRVSVMFHFMLLIILLVQFGLLRGHLLGNSCPLG